jgi:flagella basal body P-ring formation protein FlgA
VLVGTAAVVVKLTQTLEPGEKVKMANQYWLFEGTVTDCAALAANDPAQIS